MLLCIHVVCVAHDFLWEFVGNVICGKIVGNTCRTRLTTICHSELIAHDINMHILIPLTIGLDEKLKNF